MAGYTYQADTYCMRHVAPEVLRIAYGNGQITEADASPLALAVLDLTQGNLSEQNLETLSESVLDRLAPMLGIVDRLDERTYDSEDFPKYFPRSEDDEVCAVCGNVIASDHLERPEVTRAREDAEQRAYENAARSAHDAITSAAIIGRAYGRTMDSEESARIAVDAIMADLAILRGQDQDVPMINYAGTVL